MALSALHERLYEEIQHLSDEQVQEVLLFVEFLSIREDKEFIEYVNERTQQALDARGNGRKFYCLEELQREFSKT
jgi:hypothetical protein